MVKRQGKREGQYHVWPEYNEGDIRGITFMFCSNCGKEIRAKVTILPYRFSAIRTKLKCFGAILLCRNKGILNWRLLDCL